MTSAAQKFQRGVEGVTLVIPLLRELARWVRTLRRRRQARREARREADRS